MVQHESDRLGSTAEGQIEQLVVGHDFVGLSMPLLRELSEAVLMKHEYKCKTREPFMLEVRERAVPYSINF